MYEEPESQKRGGGVFKTYGELESPNDPGGWRV